MVSKSLLYYIEYPFFIFIFPHLHPNTCFHGYFQSQHHSLSKCQTRQGKLSPVAFSVPYSSQTPWSWRPRRRNLPVSSSVPSFYRERCLAHYQFGVHPLIKLDQILLCWLISSLTEAVLAHVIRLTTSRDVWCSFGANLCVTLQR